MKTGFLISVFLGLLALSGNAAVESGKDTQREYERSIEAVIRNKYFYKSSRIELGLLGGIMPYDSTVSHYLVGGRGTWHLSDHYGWEIIDVQAAFSSINSFSNDLVRTKSISNFQSSKLKLLASTNFLLSPLYGKIRFIGKNVLFFDLYFVGGVGMAQTETFQLVNVNTSTDPTLSSVRTGMEPMVDFGLGIKIFMNDAVGLLIDFRDYLVYGEVYGKKGFKSNFSVVAGLSFFLPNF